jgi:hypothetical protein
MTPKEVNDCLDRVLSLPVSRRAYCILLAAEPVQHLWTKYCLTHELDDYSAGLIEAFRNWYSDEKMIVDLKGISDLFYKTLPRNLAQENDPAGGYAGWSLHDISMIALEQCEDVEPDILGSAVFYAAAAALNMQHRAFGINTSMLSEGEIEFIEKWYSKCAEHFPELCN